MTLNEKEILGQGFPWLSNRVMAFSRAQWKPGTWTHDARRLSQSESLEATSHIFRGQITVRFPGRQLFQKLYFSIIMVWNVNFAKRRENPGNSFLCSHLQGAQWERLQGQCWHALSQCGGVHHAIIFLDLTQFLAEQVQGFPGIGYFPSLLLKLLIQEGSQSVKKCAFFSLTREATFLLSLAALSQTYLSSIPHWVLKCLESQRFLVFFYYIHIKL